MVVPDELTLEPVAASKAAALKLVEETAFVAEDLGLDDQYVGNAGFDDLHAFSPASNRYWP